MSLHIIMASLGFPLWLRLSHYINLSWQLPPLSAFHPYDALQQLAYAFVVFLLGPFMLMTGAAMSPAE